MMDTLTRAGLPAFLATIESYAAASATEGGEASGDEARAPRSYAGYPQVTLPQVALPVAPAPPTFAQRLRGALRGPRAAGAGGSTPGLGGEELTLAQALWQRRSPSPVGGHGAAAAPTSESRRAAAPLTVGASLPSAAQLARLLRLAHGISGTEWRGPTPSAGGLQALELYLAVWDEGAWLDPGSYHYDRRAHGLARLTRRRDAQSLLPPLPATGADESSRAAWRERVPSLGFPPLAPPPRATASAAASAADQRPSGEGGAGLLILVGDLRRVEAKYGERAERFLLLEAGHLMQSLCLLAQELATDLLPLGGALEREVAAALRLPPGDAVLYLAAFGAR